MTLSPGERHAVGKGARQTHADPGIEDPGRGQADVGGLTCA